MRIRLSQLPTKLKLKLKLKLSLAIIFVVKNVGYESYSLAMYLSAVNGWSAATHFHNHILDKQARKGLNLYSYYIIILAWNLMLFILHNQVFSRGTRAQHLTLCGVCVCGVPWMDAMLKSVREERQLYSHNQCIQYMCTHNRGHNIEMNRAGILA